MKLKIDAVHQPQHLELVFGEFTCETALHLIAEFRDTLVDQRAIDFIISIHNSGALSRSRKVNGDALAANLFTEVAGLDGAVVVHGDRRDIGTDGANVIGCGFSKQRTRIIGSAHDGSLLRGRWSSLYGHRDKSPRRPRYGWQSPPTGR